MGSRFFWECIRTFFLSEYIDCKLEDWGSFGQDYIEYLRFLNKHLILSPAHGLLCMDSSAKVEILLDEILLILWHSESPVSAGSNKSHITTYKTLCPFLR